MARYPHSPYPCRFRRRIPAPYLPGSSRCFPITSAVLSAILSALPAFPPGHPANHRVSKAPALRSVPPAWKGFRRFPAHGVNDGRFLLSAGGASPPVLSAKRHIPAGFLYKSVFWLPKLITCLTILVVFPVPAVPVRYSPIPAGCN